MCRARLSRTRRVRTRRAEGRGGRDVSGRAPPCAGTRTVLPWEFWAPPSGGLAPARGANAHEADAQERQRGRFGDADGGAAAQIGGGDIHPVNDHIGGCAAVGVVVERDVVHARRHHVDQPGVVGPGLHLAGEQALDREVGQRDPGDGAVEAGVSRVVEAVQRRIGVEADGVVAGGQKHRLAQGLMGQVIDEIDPVGARRVRAAADDGVGRDRLAEGRAGDAVGDDHGGRIDQLGTAGAPAGEAALKAAVGQLVDGDGVGGAGQRRQQDQAGEELSFDHLVHLLLF